MNSFSFERHLLVPWLLGTFSVLSVEAAGAQLAMGFRVGEVRQDSAVIWTRITKSSERNWKGYREPTKRQPYIDEYVPSTIKVWDRLGEVAGAPGQVRVRYTPSTGGVATCSDWVTALADNDYVHQF